MENKHKFKFLPKALSFQSRLSPERNPHRQPAHIRNGFSGPIPPLIPRRRSARLAVEQEPTSPKVSCIGRVRSRKKKKMKNNNNRNGSSNNKKASWINLLFWIKKEKKKQVLDQRAPPRPPPPQDEEFEAPRLSQLKKFASGRDTLSGFDWRNIETRSPERQSNGDDDVIIPFSAPMLGSLRVGSVSEPRNEISLWKRRTMAQPKPLHLNP